MKQIIKSLDYQSKAGTVEDNTKIALLILGGTPTDIVIKMCKGELLYKGERLCNHNRILSKQRIGQIVKRYQIQQKLLREQEQTKVKAV